MKILITGSSGMLGTELSGALKGQNEIVGLDVLKPQAPDQEPQTFHEASITDTESVKEIFEKERPDLVIHAAAWTDVDGCEKDPKKAHSVNVEGTRNIACTSNERDIPVIFISTDFIFNGEKDSPYTEDDAGSPLSIYSRTKWEAEEFIRQNLARYVIVRTSWLFGKYGKNFVDAIITKSKTEKKLRVVNDQIGSPTYAKDLARAIGELLVSVDISGQDIFHVSNSGQCSWFDFAKEIVADMKNAADVVLEPITSDELGRPARRPRFSVLDNKKFQDATGHKMRPWQEALEDYVNNECL